MNTEINSRISALREKMKERSISACIIPSFDCHNSEYVNDCFKYRAYYSGFTGSAGTLFVTLTKGYLITDGRYFLQATNQLKGTGIDLVRDGVENEPDIFTLIKQNLSKGDSLFSDGKLMTCAFMDKLNEVAKDIGINIKTDNSPIIAALNNFPSQTFMPINSIPMNISGISTLEKISHLREKMREYGSEAHIITSLEEIAWLLNMRGNDVKNTPVFYAYFYLTQNEAFVFLDNAAAANVKNELEACRITLCNYTDFYTFLQSRNENRVLCDKQQVNASVITSLSNNCIVIDKTDPAILAKAVKNDTEIENLRRVHIKDGIAVARFMHYIKTCNKNSLTEMSVADELENFRKVCPDYLGPSFDTICAYGKNAAIIHYSATQETDTRLEDNGALLVDSGGQYLGGTTDITRVFVLGGVTEEFKIHYTEVIRSMIRLQSAVFKKGTKCAVLDMLARDGIWKLGLDYRHGTGHGVGYMLSVHEGPNRFHYANTQPALEVGMVTSDEPGIYIPEKHGIRLENELLCKNISETEYGQFLGFEPLTLCPIDLDAIIPEFLDNSDRLALNAYHKAVFEALSSQANDDEIEWLKYYTREI